MKIMISNNAMVIFSIQNIPGARFFGIFDVVLS